MTQQAPPLGCGEDEATNPKIKVKSLYKAIRLLDCFMEGTPVLGVTELAEKTGMLKSTVSNILSTFEAAGLVEKDRSNGKYRMGVKNLEYSNQIHLDNDLRRVLHPTMERIANLCGETVYLATFYGTEIIYLDSIFPRSNATGKNLIGLSAPAYCTGIGKALLAYQPPEVVDKVLGLPLTAFTPNTIRRVGADYHSLSPSGEFASATMLRQRAQQYGVRQLQPFVPEPAYELYHRDYALGRGGASMYGLEQVILYHLRTLSAARLAELPDVREGLEHRFREAALRADSLDGLLMQVKSKRYAMSRIKRILLCATLGITREDAALKPGYIRVLAFNQRGREILRAAKKSGTLPIYHSFADLERDFPVHAQKEAMASFLFAAALPKARGGFSEYRDAGPAFVQEGE